jgi:hypothetical protein
VFVLQRTDSGRVGMIELRDQRLNSFHFISANSSNDLLLRSFPLMLIIVYL